MTKLNSPITRLGGKRRLRSKLVSMLPEHKCYVEPFFGAGWVYFYKDPSKAEVINDLDGEVVNLFRCIKEHREEFERLVNCEINGRQDFLRHLHTNTAQLTDIQRAVRYYYLIHFSYGGKGRHYGYSTQQPPKQKFFDVKELEKVQVRLRNTYIESLDYLQIIKKYDREDTLFFLDPPYLDTDIEFSPDMKVTFDRARFDEMKEALRQIKGKFILTVNDHEYLRELFKDFEIESVQVRYSVCKDDVGRGEYGELIINN